MSELPLAGITVADFGQFIAGPAVGQSLAELGARVVKVEPVAGDAARAAGALGEAMIRTNNRDKLSLAVDLRHANGDEIARRLIADCDVVIENMRPGAMERLGLGGDDVLVLNPRAVYLSITAYGRDAAPSRAGLDIAAQAESGMMSVTGEADGEPQRVGFTVVDGATAYSATNAVLAALLRRERTGRGTVVDTSLYQVAVHLQGAAWTAMFASGVEPVRRGNGYPTAAPAAEVIEVRDGRIVLSAYTPAHWARLCTAIGRPELQTDPRFATSDDRVAHRAEMRAELSSALAGYLIDEAVAFLSSRGVVAGAIRGYQQVVESADAQRLGVFACAQADDGTGYRYPAAPYTFRDVERTPSRTAPELGADSRAVLLALGYAHEDVDRLVAAGVVVDGNRHAT
ncbi:MAG TPA: CoA transferase [Jatrophihabitantaceae bacterium]|nr:CoA transferase [Jatrophihabitantaceae bacterium]